MLTISQDQFGGPEVLHPVEIDRPAPGLGEILVRVHAAGVNPVDVMNRETGVLVGDPPFVLGWDVSGTVEAVGFGVTLYRPGDEVFGMLPFPGGHGAYAEFVVGPTRVFAPKPANIDHVQAAALPLAGLTALQALVETAEITAESRVLITAAAGGVGHLAVQIAKAYGAYVYGLVGPEASTYVTGLGADEVIDYTTTDFASVTGPLDVVFDLVGNDYLDKALQVLNPGGMLVSTLPQTLRPVAKSAAEKGIRLAGLMVEADRLGMTTLAALVSQGDLVPTVAATYPLSAAGRAQATKCGPGKTVLLVADHI